MSADWLDVLKDIRDRKIAQPEPSTEAVFTNAAYEETDAETQTEALAFPVNAIYRIAIDFSVQDDHGSWRSKRTPYTVAATSAKAALDKALQYAMKLYNYDAIDQARHPSLEVKILKEDTACESCGEVHPLDEAEYDGRTVTLNEPFRSNDGKHKFYVYVQNDKGNVIKLGFGDPNMEIKRDDPDRRKAYRDRHNCSDPGPKWKANYWSCRMWSSEPVSKITEAVHARRPDKRITSKVMGSAGQMEHRGRSKSGKSISVRMNAYGNWYGYVGTTRVHMFMGWDNNEDDAIAWLSSQLDK